MCVWRARWTVKTAERRLNGWTNVLTGLKRSCIPYSTYGRYALCAPVFVPGNGTYDHNTLQGLHKSRDRRTSAIVCFLPQTQGCRASFDDQGQCPEWLHNARLDRPGLQQASTPSSSLRHSQGALTPPPSPLIPAFVPRPVVPLVRKSFAPTDDQLLCWVN